MIATTTKELVRLSALRGILASAGPCVTILLPAYKPGEQAGTPAARLSSMIREAEQKLGALVNAETVEALLNPLKEAALDPDLSAGSHWARVIFRSPTVFEQFQLTQIQPAVLEKAALTVGGSFLIRPVIEELALPEMFYILNLSKTKVELMRCTGTTLERIKLPKGIPETLAEAMDLEPPDHDLENRSSAGNLSAGGSTGNMKRVRFGTGSERETAHTHLADFYKLVDRGLKELTPEQEAPLILAGVTEETALYREASNYRGLTRREISKPGADLPGDVILEKGYAILHAEAEERRGEELLAAKERAAARFSTDPDFILRKAFEGRVGKLYLNRAAEKIEVFERGNHHSWGREDLLNLAAVETLLHSGEAWELEAAKMPGGAPLVGILRY